MRDDETDGGRIDLAGVAEDDGADAVPADGTAGRGGASFDPTPYLRQLRGRGGGQDYLDVKWRLLWLRREHPDAEILTEHVRIEGDSAIFKATVSLPTGGKATGYGSETASDFGDFIEKAETKAIGRALNALGYGAQFGERGDEDGPPASVPPPPARRPAPPAARPVATVPPAPRPAPRGAPSGARDASAPVSPTPTPSPPGNQDAVVAAAAEPSSPPPVDPIGADASRQRSDPPAAADRPAAPRDGSAQPGEGSAAPPIDIGAGRDRSSVVHPEPGAARPAPPTGAPPSDGPVTADAEAEAETNEKSGPGSGGGSEPDLADYSWSAFWPWARGIGLNGPKAVEGLIGRQTAGLTPAELRDLIVAARGGA